VPMWTAGIAVGASGDGPMGEADLHRAGRRTRLTMVCRA